MTSIRPAAVAGSFYPAEARELSALLDDCFASSPVGPGGAHRINSSIVAGLVPHAGPTYSGPCAACFYAELDSSIERIILLGVNHRARGHRAALSPWSHWETPLGPVAVDDQLGNFLADQVDFLKRDPAAHAEEHSIEIQLPFLQRALRQFEFVPISLSHLSRDEAAELGKAIATACRVEAGANLRTVVLASSDLSHYLSPRETNELDRLALEQILALDPDRLLRVIEEEGITMCGVLPAAVMLFAVNALGPARAKLLKHCHSGDVTPMRRVVGYASVAIER